MKFCEGAGTNGTEESCIGQVRDPFKLFSVSNISLSHQIL